jgi:hypothetical protein
MMEFIVVGFVVAVAAVLLGRALYRSVGDNRPTCACGQLDCPLVGDCDDPSHAHADADGRPVGCPLAAVDALETKAASPPAPTR